MSEEKSVIEFPKWVVPHASHIVRQTAQPGESRPGTENSLLSAGDAPDHISTPAWTEFSVNRVTGEVMVLVQDAEEEAKALAEHVAPEKKDESASDPDLAHANDAAV